MGKSSMGKKWPLVNPIDEFPMMGLKHSLQTLPIWGLVTNRCNQKFWFSSLVVYQAINEDSTNQLVGFNAHLLVKKEDFPLRIQLRWMVCGIWF
jgi:hypothetical protein